MKKTKTTITMLCAGIALTFGLLFSSCAKDGTIGPKGETGAAGNQGTPGPTAKTFTFNCSFSSTSTYDFYNGVTGFDTDDVLMFYILNETIGGSAYYAPIPLDYGNFVNIYPEFQENNGTVIIYTVKSDGTAGSPWASNVTFKFKAVLIKSAQRVAQPNVNLNDYAAVKKAYNIKD